MIAALHLNIILIIAVGGEHPSSKQFAIVFRATSKSS